MIEIINKSQCCGCNACVNICPQHCIAMVEDEEGFLYPIIENKKCINCGVCEKACPISLKTEVKEKPLAYAAINKNLEQRLNSSSGGIFVLLAEYIVERGGVVFGASFDTKFQVIHDYTETLSGISEFQGSKYVQSKIGNVYIEVKEFLQSGRLVLFTGTPCQIEGLKAYLQKDYENLLCMDIICHGVPSPKVWEKYVNFRELRAGLSTQQIFFRHKKYGWKKYAVLFEFTNNTAYLEKFPRDLYMQVFLNNVCLRPSCMDCNFKKVNRMSDITLADFWGVENVASDIDDDKGTSLVIVHSEKGQHIFDELNGKMVNKQVSLEKAIKYNPAMVQSAKESRYRKKFFEDLDKLSFEKLAAKYAKPKITVKKVAVFFLQKLGILESVKKMLRRL